MIADRLMRSGSQITRNVVRRLAVCAINYLIAAFRVIPIRIGTVDIGNSCEAFLTNEPDR